jgi:ATP synthase in type III secretion protein N
MAVDLRTRLSTRLSKAIELGPAVAVEGRLTRAVGQLLQAELPQGYVGEICDLHSVGGAFLGSAEIVGFSGATALLAPHQSLAGLSPETIVRPTGHGLTFPVGESLLGRIVDSRGQPLDGLAPLAGSRAPLHRAPPEPMERMPITEPFLTGIAAIDGLATLGKGQRAAVIGPAGSGKSHLVGQLVAGGQYDMAVIGMVGERGREVRDFVEHMVPAHLRSRLAIVVATSDRPPLDRLHAAHAATTVAEHFRDRGANVLLVIDSITRFSRALREVGLSAGEPPTRRGFPASVFAELPRLFERAGRTNAGSITAIYTLLVESERDEDPIAEETRSLVDAHLILSGRLAAAGHYPAIDVLASKSRLMERVVSSDHARAASAMRDILQAWDEVELLVQVGEYRQGRDARADRAVSQIEAVRGYCRKVFGEPTALWSVQAQLQSAVG